MRLSKRSNEIIGLSRFSYEYNNIIANYIKSKVLAITEHLEQPDALP